MKHPTDAAGNKMYLSEFEFPDGYTYDDILSDVQSDAYDVAVSNLDVDGTEPDSNERWELWEADARRVVDEFEKFYKNQILQISA
jgi:hypothetical protein